MTTKTITLRVEIEREEDGRWLADVVDLPGVMKYGKTQEEAVHAAAELARDVIFGRLKHGEPIPQIGEDDCQPNGNLIPILPAVALELHLQAA